MKVTVVQEDLLAGLVAVGRAVATRSALPVTSHVLLSTDGGRLKLSATNLEIAISRWVGAKVEAEGALAVPARLLTEFVKALPNDRIDISLTKRTLSLQCGGCSAHIKEVDAGDFPPIPQVTGGVSTRIDPEALRQGVAMVAFAAATEDTRPVLTGVNMELEGEKLTLVAADGYSLARLHLGLLSPVAQRTVVIVPAAALTVLARLLPPKKPTEVLVNPGLALFRWPGTEITIKLIQGTFPHYHNLIPTGYETRTVVDTAAFKRAARIASLFARVNNGSGIVRLVIIPGTMTVSTLCGEELASRQTLSAEVEGKKAKIAFNGKYLTDVLGVIKEEKVAIETTSLSSPGVLRPVGTDTYTHVVMPMNVQWEGNDA